MLVSYQYFHPPSRSCYFVFKLCSKSKGWSSSPGGPLHSIQNSHLSMPSQRPTLPSIHSLDLLPLCKEVDTSNKPLNYLSCPRAVHQNRRLHRQASISSSTSSRTPSPSSSRYPSLTFPAGIRLRLVPCPLDAADAVVVVPPPDAPYIPPLSSLQTPLFLVGPALQQFRQPHRPLAKGARVHPYRILRNGEVRRSPSVSLDPDMSISL
ncbi:uncharacterized protein EV420DRAFT_1540666 [Desarmillaria tabescens]|uniref:Uncharacterized protein n=1 Tax=Armillaria tabescens TaxID=1929756 RepID=A0AA39N633_ARMTA|nr:uncharacterized protein EV420DRAFT_1540666 [Desarmillaria tabescens]KAK0458809.1 hypothetical protein EV420DRAFT_1540666 [Desarmillaria tabescens]